jgi:hypothetical protein
VVGHSKLSRKYCLSTRWINAHGFAPGQVRIVGVIACGVEKGTKAVISANRSVYGEPTFNNLRTNFVAESR